ncbi:MAG: DNA topoisomerase IV subunit A [Deltaproteobacteria bacterium]|nr:DNA topoisomerase IV subunit A [Deltaproteobacteria bacterium]
MATKKPTSKTTKKPAAEPEKPPTAKKRAKDPKDAITLDAIAATASGIHRAINLIRRPELKLPVRSLSNVTYDLKKGYFELGKDKKVRTLSVATVKTFAQTLKMMSLSAELIKTDDIATKRDAYYQSKNWGDARFEEQPESDTVMDDIEALFSELGVSREQLRFIPDQHGGSVAGELIVVDRDSETGDVIEVDCTKLGSGAYAVPSMCEHLKFRTKAKFILCIETQGMFQRLQKHNYWRKAGCVLVSMGGVPTRACRRFVRLLSEQAKIPVYAFTDCDPYGFTNIYRTLKVGSGNAAHINQFFCVPEVRYLGLTPQDIVDFDLNKATHPLAEVDVKRAFDALKNDPFFQSQKPWKAAIDMLMKMQKRAEQQALSLHGLNFVIDEYLPVKLKNIDKFLP